MVLEVGDAKDGIPGAMPACGQVGTSSETPDSMHVAGKQTENEDRVARGSPRSAGIECWKSQSYAVIAPGI